MSVDILLGDIPMTVAQRKIVCGNKEIEDSINAHVEAIILTEGPLLGTMADPDLAIAAMLEKQLGARIVSATERITTPDTDRVDF